MELHTNFISLAVAKQAHLKLCHQSGLDVRLGTGVEVSGLGVCPAVKFQVAHAEFETDFIALELGNVDVILGVQWLRTWDSVR